MAEEHCETISSYINKFQRFLLESDKNLANVDIALIIKNSKEKMSLIRELIRK